jgi:hypothetical protein
MNLVRSRKAPARNGQRVNYRPGIAENVGLYLCQPANLLAERAGVSDEDGDIAIRIGPVIAPRPRALKKHPLEPVAIDFGERGAKAGQDGVCLCIVGDCFLRACIIQGTGE